jgi:methionyl-tRNA synthetase
MDTLFVTTAIPFVNAAPHLGHALEYVQTDVVARHARARGRTVTFLTGTDEHAAKNVHAASEAHQPVDGFVAANAQRFRDLADALHVSYDDFIRTSADPRHRPAVEEIWQRCLRNGDLYRAEYSGTYCAGCEEFRDTPCPEHDAPLQRVQEENWFFRLSKYAARIHDAIAEGTLRIDPPERRNEVLAFLQRGVRDLSVSRPRARAGDWGIPVPGDPSQIVYVWFDALVNYVSAPGFDAWTDFAERVHVIGKGIVRFHAVIWPAILAAAGLPGPDALLVHDYVTVEGRKIGKSLGNAVDPAALIDRYGVDALRWWLAREVPVVGDANFSEARLVEAANRDLANGAGNLVQRVVALAAKEDVTGFTPGDDAWPLLTACCTTRTRVDEALRGLDLRRATDAVVELVAKTNRYAERSAPWSLPSRERGPAIATLLHATGVVVEELSPVVPDFCARARVRLRTLARGAPIFHRLH